jgi:carboxylate-amine ligase
MGLRLLPTAMHPWMDPRRETQLWEHENHEIYQAFHRIFDCHAHGWANVQSVHLNLPFADEHQFRQLHAAVRLILPLLPALAASSPVFDGRVAEDLDSRLVHYRQHCERVPSLIGRVIPEPVYDRDRYHRLIFDPIRSDITPLDFDQVMEVEFLNARGAIARFDRGSIEIRLMDVQESPRVDVAICALVTGVIKLLVQETWSSIDDQCDVSVDVLRSNLDQTTRYAEGAELNGSSLLRHLGIQVSQVRARECWGHLFAQVQAAGVMHPDFEETIRFLLDHGTLAYRIRQALGDPGVGQVLARETLHGVYSRLADCLMDGVQFQP